MNEKKKPVDQDRSADNKPTGGELPDKQQEFEGTTWDENADHDSTSTEAERKNVSKTSPKSPGKGKS